MLFSCNTTFRFHVDSVSEFDLQRGLSAHPINKLPTNV